MTDRPWGAVAEATRAAAVAARRHEHGIVCLVGELDQSGAAGEAGYRSTRRMVEDLLHVDPAHARRLCTQAALLAPRRTLSGEVLAPTLPATAAAHAAGLIDDAHLRVLATAMDHLARIPGLDPEAFAAAEATLADAATTLAPTALEKVAQRVRDQLDPDGAAPPEDPEPRDELHLARRRDGRLQGSFVFHGRADAEIVAEVFDRLSAPAGPRDTRPLAERRAEALTDLCAHAISPTGIATDSTTDRDSSTDSDADDSLGKDGPSEDKADGDDPVVDDALGGRLPAVGSCPRVPRPLGRAQLTITIDHRWLTRRLGHGLLDSHLPVDPATVRRLACDAAIVPLVLGARSEPLDVGRLSYTVPDPMRRALVARDRGCSFPGCTRRPARCHAHHIEHWADHGPTRIENLTLLCRFHHHLVHHGGWELAMVRGRPEYRPPAWVDPRRRAIPGGPTAWTVTALDDAA